MARGTKLSYVQHNERLISAFEQLRHQIDVALIPSANPLRLLEAQLVLIEEIDLCLDDYKTLVGQQANRVAVERTIRGMLVEVIGRSRHVSRN
jgi:hypothetical protein